MRKLEAEQIPENQITELQVTHGFLSLRQAAELNKGAVSHRQPPESSCGQRGHLEAGSG